MEEDVFEKHRAMLHGIAYRMCGVLADAQDIVQETHLKWHAVEKECISNPQAWLVTVCSRLAMDMLKSSRVQREQYIGLWLPEPYLHSKWEEHPDAQAQIDDSVSLALMLAMERLSTSERITFLLHEVFSYKFQEIADIIGKSEAACRKLASRARSAIQRERSSTPVNPEIHQRLLDAFFEAAHSGELDNLKEVLTDSAELHSDGGGKVKTTSGILKGNDAVAMFFLKIWRSQVSGKGNIQLIKRWFNGSPGMLIYQDNKLIVALSLAIENNSISHIFALRNPDKMMAFNS